MEQENSYGLPEIFRQVHIKTPQIIGTDLGQAQPEPCIYIYHSRPGQMMDKYIIAWFPGKGKRIMKYKIINEELKIASCSISDLTLEHTIEILRGWHEKEGDDISIGKLTVFFEKETGYLVINRDNAHFQIYLELAEAYMGANKETRIEIQERAHNEVGISLVSALNVMESCLIHRAVEHHMFLIGNQTDTISVTRRRVLMKILEKWDPYIAVVRAFYYGVMIGKHKERARRKKREEK